jgi:uncharacterized membrane protein
VSKLRNSVKYMLALLFCIFVRILPRPPDIEPVMTACMPIAKEFGSYSGFLFAAFSMVALDFIVGRVGYWTVYTAVAYGIVGYIAGVWLARKNEARGRDYAVFAFFATIFYDAVTALAFGMQFGQTLEATLAGQIPFTIYHLIGNVLLAYFISPVLHKWIVANPKLELKLQTSAG